MIVSEVMATKLVTVTPNDTLSHAASLLRQHQFHHLPVVQTSGLHQRMQQGTSCWYVLVRVLTSILFVGFSTACRRSRDTDQVRVHL